MSKQTAVEWLIGELKQLTHNSNYHLGLGDIRITQGMLNELYDQAKQMEKEQIADAYDNNKMGRVNHGEQYYNETYGGNNNIQR
jgi:hypothetical protein